ncbi:YihY/virulence factor BrkB family protein [Nocardioides mesophilus]|uniref:YihY/virulence factor BrkB family protein n=1 Tax=Nocardioides mesophilus TaxID=433659 RepID=A0A7G9RDP9_9ACTN|nr:YhjD/YihY/BrkB family envelope integrity protein [Nocardioides mesophilus]QNN53724.1 YihY/virulence factor BrkB family protein [Nocardioides mesophilus]
MASIKDRLTGTLSRLRERWPLLDHAIGAVGHYGKVNGSGQAGAATFFGFLSFFPILALGFFCIGLIAQVSPELRDSLRHEVENLLPGVIGNGDGEIPLRTFEKYAATVGIVGLVGLLYSGLGWLSGMRSALEVMFVTPRRDRPNFLLGKVRDLATLALIGVTLVLSVALSALVSGFSKRIVGWLGFDPESALPQALLWVIAHGLAIAASTALLMAMFTLLAQPHVPRRSLVRGALLGAVGFELLKALATYLIAQTKGQPSAQAFGVALILLVWINYFSRLVMLAAAWSYTAPAAVELRRREAMRAPAAALEGAGERIEDPVAARHAAEREQAGTSRLLAAAGATGLALAGLVVLGRRRTG